MEKIVQFPVMGLEFRFNNAIDIGPIHITYYGMIIAVGLILAMVYAFRVFRKVGIDPDKAIDCILGGILGGISDGSDIVVRAGFKPTPSVAASQQTINKDGENIAIEIKGRHDPIIVARAVVVVECMTALVLADALLVGMSAKLDNVKKVWALDEK